MFSSVTVKVDPFVKYLEFMFTDNKVNLLLYASQMMKKFYHMQAKQFYPSQINFQLILAGSHLNGKSHTAILTLFFGTSKATLAYQSRINRKFSESQISYQDRNESLKKDLNNSVSESNHSSSSHSLKNK